MLWGIHQIQLQSCIKKRFKIVSVVAKKKSSFRGFSERVCEKDPEVSVWQWWDAEKMNNSVLNIKDEGIAQQLFLFIFHWKHLDSPIHLFICFTPSSVSPSLPFKTCHSSDPFSLLSSVNFFSVEHLCLSLPWTHRFAFSILVFA